MMTGEEALFGLGLSIEADVAFLSRCIKLMQRKVCVSKDETLPEERRRQARRDYCRLRLLMIQRSSFHWSMANAAMQMESVMGVMDENPSYLLKGGWRNESLAIMAAREVADDGLIMMVGSPELQEMVEMYYPVCSLHSEDLSRNVGDYSLAMDVMYKKYEDWVVDYDNGYIFDTHFKHKIDGQVKDVHAKTVGVIYTYISRRIPCREVDLVKAKNRDIFKLKRKTKWQRLSKK